MRPPVFPDFFLFLVTMARPISQLWNFSIKLNSFPRSFKIGKVKKFFKKGSKTDSQNYRPILLFPILSKIIERIIHVQTQEFLSKSKILYRFQFGFWKNYLTNTCLGCLTAKITTGFGKGHFTEMILIDFQKAFDAIDAQILIKNKLSRVFKKRNFLVYILSPLTKI